jgi:hypothetical protein
MLRGFVEMISFDQRISRRENAKVRMASRGILLEKLKPLLWLVLMVLGSGEGRSAISSASLPSGWEAYPNESERGKIPNTVFSGYDSPSKGVLIISFNACSNDPDRIADGMIGAYYGAFDFAMRSGLGVNTFQIGRWKSFAVLDFTFTNKLGVREIRVIGTDQNVYIVQHDHPRGNSNFDLDSLAIENETAPPGLTPDSLHAARLRISERVASARRERRILWIGGGLLLLTTLLFFGYRLLNRGDRTGDSDGIAPEDAEIER